MESAKVVDIKAGESKLLRALLKARKNFKPILKDQENTFYKGSKYATLGTYIEATHEALTAEDLVLSHFLTQTEGITYVHARLEHVSGETRESGGFPLTPIKSTPDQYGSALTYGKRYTLAALLFLTSEDDDGAGASHDKDDHPEPPKPKPASQPAKPYDFTQHLPQPDVQVIMEKARLQWKDDKLKMPEAIAKLNAIAVKLDPLTVEGMLAAIKGSRSGNA